MKKTHWRPGRLKKLVFESGLSTREIAQEEGAPCQSNLSQILLGNTIPRASTVAAILRAIGKTWADLDG